MRFTLDDAGGANLVRGWENGALRINDEWVRGCVMVAATLVQPMSVGSAAEITATDLEAALVHEPEVLLIGTGARQEFLDPSIVVSCSAAGVGVEMMDTLAAARTYNLLVGEGRRVVAVLLPPNA